MDQAALVEPCNLGSHVEHHMQTQKTDLFSDMSSIF